MTRSQQGSATAWRTPSRRVGRVGATAVWTIVLLTAAAACAPDPADDPTAAPSTTATPAVDLDPVAYAAALVASTDAARVAEGLDPLPVSDCAQQAAAGRARALVGQAELTHAPLDGVSSACGVSRTAENLSRAAAPAPDVVDAWLGSPGHRNNLLDPDLREVGIGCVPDGAALLCSQVFLGS